MANSNFFISPNSLLVECVINPSNGQTVNKNPFGQQKQLDNCKVVAIQSFSDQDITYSPISSGNKNIPLSVFQTSTLTMYRAASKDNVHNNPAFAEGLYYDQIPLAAMRTTANNSNFQAGVFGASFTNMMFRLNPSEIAWTKTYITCSPSVSIASPFSALFLVHYTRPDQDWQPYA